MASLWKHPKSKYWVACYTDASGRQRKCSTKMTNRRDAQKAADALEDAHRRRMTGEQIRKSFNAVLQELTGESIATETVRQYLTGFLEKRKLEVSASTLSLYGTTARRFLEWLGGRADRELVTLTHKDIVGFRDSMAKRLHPSTVNTAVKALRVMLRAAKADGLIDVDPSERVKTLRHRRTDEESRRAFTMDELRAVLRCAGDSEWRSLILFGLYTGQRLGDLVNLRWNNVDLEAGEIRMTTRKTGRRVLVPICTPLAKHLETLACSDKGSDAVHPRACAIMQENGGGHLSREFGELLARAGLREERTHAKRKEGTGQRRELNALTFHSLRHTATSWMKNAGVSAPIVQDIIGHESAEVSKAYTHIEASTKRAALDKLPQV